MNKLILLFYILAAMLSACKPQKDTSLLFEENSVIKVGHAKSIDDRGWFVPNGQANIDTVIQYKNQKSIHISNLPQDTTKITQLYYYVNASLLEGQSIRFSGKYKYRGADSTNISFGIQQLVKEKGPVNTPPELEKRSGDSDWIDFTVEGTMDSLTLGLYFFVFTTGDIELWLSDCQAYIDNEPLNRLAHQSFPAEQDKEFDYGSAITLPEPTPQLIENLEVAGKVWGFMKYYHPAVTRGTYNWDYQLFRILPQVAQAPDKKTRNDILNKWIGQFGSIKTSAPYVIEDSTKYSRIIDLNWINDTNLFDEELISKLNEIKNAKRSQKFSYYYIPYSTDIEKREKTYAPIQWKDQGFRILTLFKFWNAMEYCFPYREMTDKPWNAVFKEYLPRFIQPKSQADYELAIHELVACIDDSHGFAGLSSEALAETVLKRRSAPNFIPATLMESASGDIVVKETRTAELERGDMIRSIDGESVEKIIRDLKPYIAVSNHAVLVRNTLPHLLRTDSQSMQVTCIRNGKEINLKLTNFRQSKANIPRQYSQVKSVEDYRLDDKNIIYINVATMGKTMIPEAINNNKDAKGMILDMRRHPNGDAYMTLYSLLCPTPQEFMWFSVNEIQAPGNYKLTAPAMFGTENPEYFKGKVAILVNENTQSHGELSSMAYRKAPRSAIIGSTTAGADGNISFFTLPGCIRGTFTALGAYYPNWEICQRKGVKIDIEARPTNEEIRNGQDVWIENAIRYISE